MVRTPVHSSIIRSVGHDAQSGTLHVEFNTGRVYLFHNVPARKHAALINAGSIGGHFKRHIEGKHRASEVPK